MAGALITFLAPNVMQLMHRYSPALDNAEFLSVASDSTRRSLWDHRSFRVLVVGILFAVSLMTMQRISPFLYFQF